MMSKLQNYLSVLTAVVELVFFSGLIFGWSSITYVLQKEGFFSYLCSLPGNESSTTPATSRENASSSPPENEVVSQKCKFQDESFNLVFTVASFMLSISTLVNGYIFDRFGTWVARIIAIVLFSLGAVMLSFINVQTSILLYPAMCCFAIGGILLLVTNMQLGNLFPRFKSSIITLMNGSLDSSSVVFLLVKLAYDSGISFNFIFLFILFCTLFLWMRTFLFLPQAHVPVSVPKKTYQYGLHDCTALCSKSDSEEIALKENEAIEKKTSSGFDLDQITFWSCMKTWHFWTNFFHFSVLQLRNYFFFSSFYSWLKNILPESQINVYLTTFGICQFFGMVCAPLNGVLMDAVKHFNKSKKSKISLSLTATSLSAFVTSTWGVLFSLCILLPYPELQYFSFVLQVIFRSFLYGGNASFIALLFPIHHFGKIYGMTLTLSGIVSLLQFPFFTMVLRVFEGDFLIINVVFLIFCFLSYVHPVYLYVKSKKMDKEIEIEDVVKENPLMEKS